MFTFFEYRTFDCRENPTSIRIYNDPDRFLVSVNGNEIPLSESVKALFLQKISDTGIEVMFPRFEQVKNVESGSDWYLDIVSDSTKIHCSGPKNSILNPYLREFQEIFDSFLNTNLISSARIDSLEIVYKESVTDPFLLSLSDLGDCSHKEYISLDRASWTITYKRRFPQNCFHSTFECHCENQISSILDRLEELIQKHFPSNEGDNSPAVTFRIKRHDGSVLTINRTLSEGSLNDALLDALMKTIAELLQWTGMQNSMFSPFM